MDAEREYDYGLEPGESYEPVDADDAEAGFDLAAPHVMTVLGPIAPPELGLTLAHEHVLAAPPVDHDGDPDRLLDDPHAALAELEDLYAAGGRAIVDSATADSGRDAPGLLWVAARAPVHIIATTGHHKELHSGRMRAALAANDVAATCVAEIATGIEGTTARAGVITAGSSRDRIEPVEEIALRAAARAHRHTGAPLFTHCDGGTMAAAQLRILGEEGVAADRIAFGHQDFRLDEPYLRRILETGAFVSFDQIAKHRHGTDADRAAMVVRLVAAGFGDQILLSGDISRRSSLRAYGGMPGLAAILTSFPLILMEAGLAAAMVRRLFVDNPTRWLTIRPPATT